MFPNGNKKRERIRIMAYTRLYKVVVYSSYIKLLMGEYEKEVLGFTSWREAWEYKKRECKGKGYTVIRWYEREL